MEYKEEDSQVPILVSDKEAEELLIAYELPAMCPDTSRTARFDAIMDRIETIKTRKRIKRPPSDHTAQVSSVKRETRESMPAVNADLEPIEPADPWKFEATKQQIIDENIAGRINKDLLGKIYLPPLDRIRGIIPISLIKILIIFKSAEVEKILQFCNSMGLEADHSVVAFAESRTRIAMRLPKMDRIQDFEMLCGFCRSIGIRFSHSHLSKANIKELLLDFLIDRELVQY